MAAKGYVLGIRTKISIRTKIRQILFVGIVGDRRARKEGNWE